MRLVVFMKRSLILRRDHLTESPKSSHGIRIEDLMDRNSNRQCVGAAGSSKPSRPIEGGLDVEPVGSIISGIVNKQKDWHRLSKPGSQVGAFDPACHESAL